MITKICPICNNLFSGPNWYIKNLKYCSNKCVGVRNRGENNPMKLLENREKLRIANLGKKTSEETKKKLHKIHKKNWKIGREKLNSGNFQKGIIPWNTGKKCLQLSGQNHGAWKGGITPLYKKIRQSFEYQQWRKSIFERDNYTCQKCNQRGKKLQADHIKKFALYPELRFDLNNGRTLCIPCHKETDTWGRRNG